MGWLDALMKIVGRLLKAAPAFIAYIFGRKHAADKAEKQAQKAEDKAEAKQDAKDIAFEQRRRDESLRERLRNLLRKNDAPDDGNV